MCDIVCTQVLSDYLVLTATRFVLLNYLVSWLRVSFQVGLFMENSEKRISITYLTCDSYYKLDSPCRSWFNHPYNSL